MKRNSLLSISVLLTVVIGIIAFLFVNSHINRIQLEELNSNMLTPLQLGMSEKEVVAAIGEGIFQPGFGGYYLIYEDITVGFSEDLDNDLYQKVTVIEWNNENYSVFGIRVGDTLETSINILQREGFGLETELIFNNGEYYVHLLADDGSRNIRSIRVSFEDKDLQDRYY